MYLCSYNSFKESISKFYFLLARFSDYLVSILLLFIILNRQTQKWFNMSRFQLRCCSNKQNCWNISNTLMVLTLMFRPVIIAPAMNTFMYEHPVTQPQLETIKTWGFTVLEPQVIIIKVVSCLSFFPRCNRFCHMIESLIISCGA